MKYDKAFFDKHVERVGTRSVKWDAAAKISPDMLPMWVADWDFQCAEPIVQALKDRAEHPCYGYNIDDGNDEKAFCSYWQRRHALTVQPEQTYMLPCVVTGLKLCARCFAKKGESIVIMPPVYGPFRASVEINGRVAAAAPLIPDAAGRYDIDFAAVEARLQEGAKAVFFCNPHNPVSRAWVKEELQRLVDLCNAYNAILVSDEIHADFVYSPNTFIPMLSLNGAENCVIAMASASKTFNVPGLEQSMILSYNPDLLEMIRKEAESAGVTSGNTFALAATQKAYTECDDWLDGMLVYLEESRQIIKEEIARLLPKAVLSPIEATALCWIDLRAYAATCEEIDTKLRAKGLMLNRGTFFDAALGEGFARLNFACPHDRLKEGLARLAAAFNE